MSSIIRNNNIEKHPCSIADIENEIKIAEEKQERSTVIKLKRQLKKMLINEHTNNSGEMPSKDRLNPLEYAKYNIKGKQIYIGASRPVLVSPHLLMSELNIVGVLNVTKEVAFSSSTLNCKDLKLKQISVIDRPTEHINEYFDTAFDFIDSCLDNGTTSNAVFVHCQRGISRSATIVMAYAIFHGMTLSEITSIILKSRPQVKPNVGFWKILCDYEFKCLGKNTVTINHWKERQVNEDDNSSSKKEKKQPNNHTSNTIESRLKEIHNAKKNLESNNDNIPFIANAKKYCGININSNNNNNNNNNTKTNKKIIHFVRHGEGFHNALARKIGRKAYLDPAVFDPELTDVGIQQAKDLQDEVLNLYLNDPNSIDCIVFSPMKRALMTGTIACEKVLLSSNNNNDNKLPKMVAVECIRERYGVHICDSRRTIDIIQKEYPNIDFTTNIEDIKDTLHKENERETHEHVILRGYEFLDWLKNQDDTIQSVIVFSHSSYLMNMFNAVLHFEANGNGNDDNENNNLETISNLKKWFNTGELKSVEVTFNDRF